MVSAAKMQTADEGLVKARRRQIFLAVTRVLARKSFHQATVKEMALEAGVAAGSIYMYVRSKDEILLLLAESMVGELVEELPAIRARTQDEPRAELLAIMRTALEVIDRYREAFAVLNHELRYLEQNAEYRAALKDLLRPYKGALAGALERGRARGLIHFDDLPSVVEALHMLCSGLSMGASMLAKTDKETYWREIERIVAGQFFGQQAEVRGGED
ncbi:MAG TPA: TetR/AcrR family transcriptional regulator [Candidatus Binataceae bacterium]|nr:TetR/AcrR family transcriptional regulator [Candidatus Binataceae bacterium]